MVKIFKHHSVFDRHYKKRILPSPAIDIKFQERVSLFIKNSNNPILKDHPLTGKKRELRSFSITGDIRVIYKEEPLNVVTFLDIGTHNQVY